MVIWGLAAGTENYIYNKSISWALYKAPEIKQKNQSRFSNLIKKTNPDILKKIQWNIYPKELTLDGIKIFPEVVIVTKFKKLSLSVHHPYL